MNRCVLIGRLTRDPDSTQTASGIALCRFSIAVNRKYTNADGEREVDFLNIVTWRNQADNCAKYLSKGMRVAVCGSIQVRSYEDKDGNKRQATEVVADEVEFLSSKEKTADEPHPDAAAQYKQTSISELKPLDNDNDLPF